MSTVLIPDFMADATLWDDLYLRFASWVRSRMAT